MTEITDKEREYIENDVLAVKEASEKISNLKDNTQVFTENDCTDCKIEVEDSETAIFDAIYMVKIYLNKELIYIEHYTDIYQAQASANMWEDKDYICEIEVFRPVKIIDRGFWRNAKPEL